MNRVFMRELSPALVSPANARVLSSNPISPNHPLLSTSRYAERFICGLCPTIATLRAAVMQ